MNLMSALNLAIPTPFSSGLNQQKGAGDAATWLPPNKSFRCEYARRIVEVKAAYELWVTEAEKDALSRLLNAC